MEIKTVSDFRKAMRNGPYAWPGGYPCYFLMADGEAVSFKAAKENRREMLWSLVYGGPADRDWKPVALEINYEDGDLMCAHMGERIESAYAEEDAK